MNASAAFSLLSERADGWAAAHGIYADLSRWPAEVTYYVKCPICGSVHGSYKSMREAHASKLCGPCNLKAVGKLKDEIVDVVHDPEHKPKAMAKILGEADTFDVPPDDAPDPDALDPHNLKLNAHRLLLGNWVDVALRDYMVEQKIYDLPEIDVDWSERYGNYDPENKDDTKYFKITTDGMELLFFRNEDVAIEYAREKVISDLENQPEVFTRDWLMGFVDNEKMQRHFGDPNEDWENQMRDKDYEEQLEALTNNGTIEDDDPVFYRLNGSPRKENPGRRRALDTYLERYLENNKPYESVMDFLKEVYGEDEIMKQIADAKVIDIDKAADSALQVDGWAHFAAHYDGDSHELENGAVYVRPN